MVKLAGAQTKVTESATLSQIINFSALVTYRAKSGPGWPFGKKESAYPLFDGSLTLLKPCPQLFISTIHLEPDHSVPAPHPTSRCTIFKARARPIRTEMGGRMSRTNMGHLLLPARLVINNTAAQRPAKAQGNTQAHRRSKLAIFHHKHRRCQNPCTLASKM